MRLQFDSPQQLHRVELVAAELQHHSGVHRRLAAAGDDGRRQPVLLWPVRAEAECAAEQPADEFAARAQLAAAALRLRARVGRQEEAVHQDPVWGGARPEEVCGRRGGGAGVSAGRYFDACGQDGLQWALHGANKELPGE